MTNAFLFKQHENYGNKMTRANKKRYIQCKKRQETVSEWVGMRNNDVI